MANVNSDNYALSIASPPEKLDNSKSGGRVRAIVDSSASTSQGAGDAIILGDLPERFKFVSLTIEGGVANFNVVSLNSDGTIKDTADPDAANDADVGKELPRDPDASGEKLALEDIAGGTAPGSFVLQYTSGNS